MQTDIAFFRNAMSAGSEYQWTVFWNNEAWEIHAYHDPEQEPAQLRDAGSQIIKLPTLDAAADVLKTLGVGKFSVAQYRTLPHEKRVSLSSEQCIGT